MKVEIVFSLCCFLCLFVDFDLSAGDRGSWARPDLVDKVSKGEIGSANVSWWGTDENDAGRFVQAAIDSNAATVTLDRVTAVWTVGKTIRGRSNQTLVIPAGVELRAKRGAFRGTGESLLSYSNKSDFTVTGGGRCGCGCPTTRTPRSMRSASGGWGSTSPAVRVHASRT